MLQVTIKDTIQDTENGKVIVDEEVRGMVMTSLLENQFGDEKAFCNTFIVDKLNSFDVVALLKSTIDNLVKAVEKLDAPTQLLFALYLNSKKNRFDFDELFGNGDDDNGTDEII